MEIYSVDRPPANSGEGVLGQGPKSAFFLDMSSLANNSALSRWLAGSHKYYSIGGEGIDPKRSSKSFMHEFKLKEAYDGYVYLQRTHAARQLEEVRDQLPHQRDPIAWTSCKNR
ncbi:MAG: erythromycin esterase family protein [Thermosynechococcaceae cyanobacterium]